MKEVDDRYGPLEWRLPEAHAIYWAALGLREAERHPDKVKQSDLITLRRVIYQDMQLSFERGRLVVNPVTKRFDLAPNLGIIENVNAAYERALSDDEEMRDNIRTAHRNFLRVAVYLLYEHNRIKEAQRWFDYLGKTYPNKPIIDDDPKSLPATVSLDRYALACAQVDINESNRDLVTSAIEGMLVNSYTRLAMGEDAEAEGFQLLAQKIWEAYRNKVGDSRWDAVGIPPPAELAVRVRNEILDPQTGMIPEARAILRSKLNLGPEPAVSTNAPPARAEAKPEGVL